MVKKILSIGLILTIILSVNAFALTATQYLNTKNGNTLVLGVGAGIVTTATKVTEGSDTYIKLKSVLYGQMADISSITVGYKYTTSMFTPVDENNTTITSASTQETMKNLFTGVTVDGTQWLRSKKFNSTGYISYGFAAGVGTNRYSLAEGQTADFAEAKFKVAASTLLSDIPNNIWYSGNAKAFTAIGSTNVYSFYALTEAPATGPTVKSNEPFTFDWSGLAPAANKITATVGANGTISVAGATKTGNVYDIGSATSAVITITPDAGYQIASASYNGTPVTITDGTYTAQNVTSSSTFSVTFSAIPHNFITATVNGSAYGKVFVDNTAITTAGQQVDLGTTATTAKLTVIPKIGYQVTATLEGATITTLGADGGIVELSGISGTKALEVTFAPRQASVTPQISHKVFQDADTVTWPGAPTPKKALTTFASKPASGVVGEFGVLLTKKDGSPAVNGLGAPLNVTKIGSTDYSKFAFDTTKFSVSGTSQYGIQFIGLPAGDYIAIPYAYVDGVAQLGVAVPFTAAN